MSCALARDVPLKEDFTVAMYCAIDQSGRWEGTISRGKENKEINTTPVHGNAVQGEDGGDCDIEHRVSGSSEWSTRVRSCEKGRGTTEKR